MHTILCILIEISVKIRSYLSCVPNGEFYFSLSTNILLTCKLINCFVLKTLCFLVKLVKDNMIIDRSGFNGVANLYPCL